MWRKEDVVDKLKKAQGSRSLRHYANFIGCSAAYLSDVYLGKRDPGPKLLDSLGLECERIVTKNYKLKEKRTK
jgi:hypothetical protein